MDPIVVDIEDELPTDSRLSEALSALSHPGRLALLRQLRTPRTLREIRVRAGEAGVAEGSPDRALARQTVKAHLDRLLEIGVVTARESSRDYGPAVEYILNHQSLFALSEEFRSLARLRPVAELEAATRPQSATIATGDFRGPCFVLVKGLDEGRSFDLTPPVANRSEWVIGRRRGLAVCLDFDPFVSTEHALVTWSEGTHSVMDLPDSRNGTAVNFRTVAKGARRSLRTGDLVSVGRSILMFHA